MSQSQIEKMLKKAKGAMKKAYCPYSKFAVGACILDDQGNFYEGCNVENASYRLTVCAEQAASVNMIVGGGKCIREILIIADTPDPVSPCGACRQNIREFAASDIQVHMCNTKGKRKTAKLSELLPDSFGPEWLS